tara:strand:- start:511 stop:2076 length:1566 start_codon:yes stop_codon:yes gene_type:complete
MKKEDKHHLSIQKNREGIDFIKNGEKDNAYECFCEAINFNPKYPPPYFNLGNILMEKKIYKKAIENYIKSNTLDKRNNQYKFKLGLAYAESGEFKNSIKVFEKLLKEEDDNLEILNNLGRLHKEIGVFETSINYFEKAISLNCNFHKPYIELGILYAEQGHLEKSISLLKKALNIKNKFIEKKDLKGKELIKNKSELATIYWNLSLSNLLLNNYSDGFKQYEFRICKEFPIRPHAKPISERITKKLSLKNKKKILLVSEQGLGDTIQFVRYSQYLKNIGYEVTLCALDKLHSLFKYSNVCDNLISQIDAEKVYDIPWAPLLSLPNLLNVIPNNVLVRDKYLSVPKERIKKWEKILQKEKKPIIGINWQGNPNAEKGSTKGRSIPFHEFELLKSSSYKLLSLQKGYGLDDFEKCTFKEYFVNAQKDINNTLDFIDTAAIISCCDLVITSDSMNAHLSGSLGKETWLLLKYVPDWRWGTKSNFTHWYGSLKLYRQNSNCLWKDVFSVVANDLEFRYAVKKYNA